jgi:hypothetical protein
MKISFGVSLAPGSAAGATKLWVSVGRGDVGRQQHSLRMFGEQIMPHFT